MKIDRFCMQFFSARAQLQDNDATEHHTNPWRRFWRIPVRQQKRDKHHDGNVPCLRYIVRSKQNRKVLTAARVVTVLQIKHVIPVAFTTIQLNTAHCRRSWCRTVNCARRWAARRRAIVASIARTRWSIYSIWWTISRWNRFRDAMLDYRIGRSVSAVCAKMNEHSICEFAFIFHLFRVPGFINNDLFSPRGLPFSPALHFPVKGGQRKNFVLLEWMAFNLNIQAQNCARFVCWFRGRFCSWKSIRIQIACCTPLVSPYITNGQIYHTARGWRIRVRATNGTTNGYGLRSTRAIAPFSSTVTKRNSETIIVRTSIRWQKLLWWALGIPYFHFGFWFSYLKASPKFVVGGNFIAFLLLYI